MPNRYSLPWTMDTIENDGDYGSGEEVTSGFDSFGIYDSNNKLIMDSRDSKDKDIQEDYNEDGKRFAWDENARNNVLYAITAVNHRRRLFLSLERMLEVIRDNAPTIKHNEDILAIQEAGRLLKEIEEIDHAS